MAAANHLGGDLCFFFAIGIIARKIPRERFGSTQKRQFFRHGPAPHCRHCPLKSSIIRSDSNAVSALGIICGAGGRPGQVIRLESNLLSLREEMGAVRVRARIDGRVCTQAEQVFVFNAVPLEDDDDREAVESTERQELQRLWADYPGDF